MTSPADINRGLALRAYLLASHAIALVDRPVLRRRLARGKEHPTRWVEKRGLSLAPRPDGPLVWLHAVGLGEVLSLRGLIIRMGALRPDLSFLVTSTTAASAAAFARQIPSRTVHQFLPLDAPAYRKRFLDHFKPDLCVWAEQDLWPGLVSDMAAMGIPQVMVAARMNAASFRSHCRAKGLYRDLYRTMQLVTAQDADTQNHLNALGADAVVTGSLKPAAPALTHDATELAHVQNHLADRFVWAVAPAHPEDATIAMDAHAELRKSDPTALLIVAPRFLDAFADLIAPRRSQNELPDPSDAVWLFDTLGDLGLVYRVSRAVLIGGTFSAMEGHNPWEAAALGTAVLHGPRVANFKTDFAQLDAAQAAVPVSDAQSLTDALRNAPLTELSGRATDCIAVASQRTDALAADLAALLRSHDVT